MHGILLFSRHGKVRLRKWFSAIATKEKTKYTTDAINLILSRRTDNCNILEWKALKLIYKRFNAL